MRLSAADHHDDRQQRCTLALQAMQAGASDFIEKPIKGAELIASVKRALEQSSDAGKRSAVRQAASQHVAPA